MSETTSQTKLDDNLSANATTEPQTNNDAIQDNGAEEVDSVTPNKKLKLSNDVKEEVTPAIQKSARSGGDRAKRLSQLEKITKEGEALLKDMGHKDDDPESNRRRTRSQTRGTPPAPPPLKKTPQKEKKEPTPNSGTPPKRRGRPPKNSITSNDSNSVDNKPEANAKNDSAKSDANVTQSQDMPVNSEECATEVTKAVNDSSNEVSDGHKSDGQSNSESESNANAEQNNTKSDNNAKSISENTSNSAPHEVVP